MCQADQGHHQVDLDPGIQVDLVNLVNLVNLGPGSGCTKWARRTKVTTKWTWTSGSGLTRMIRPTRSTRATWVLVPGGRFRVSQVDQADQGDQVGLDAGIQVDQVGQVNLGPSSGWNRWTERTWVTKWTWALRSRLTRLRLTGFNRSFPPHVAPFL